MVKFRSQVDVTLPAVLWEDGETTAVNTTLHFHGELVKQWGQDDRFNGYLELEDQPFTSEESNKAWLTMAREDGGLNRGLLYYGFSPAHTFFGELYADREYGQFFLFPFERVPVPSRMTERQPTWLALPSMWPRRSPWTRQKLCWRSTAC